VDVSGADLVVNECFYLHLRRGHLTKKQEGNRNKSIITSPWRASTAIVNLQRIAGDEQRDFMKSFSAFKSLCKSDDKQWAYVMWVDFALWLRDRNESSESGA
jgi:hypothetical protein